MPILKVLRDRGVKVSADNFGTGYSSLASMQKVPLDALKIDRTFIRRITDNSGETTKVSAMVEMGRKLKLRVVANGVERTEDLELLWDHNCDEALGYYFGEPVPPEQFSEMLRSQVISTSRNSFAAA
jgi:EAL domain-containing protein (putative c-di-GMP-specific phosphodiesterase class I)